MMVKLIQKQRYLDLPDFMYDDCKPKTFTGLNIVFSNKKLLNDYGIQAVENTDLIDAFFAAETTSLSLAYAGHQFGHYSPQLGDGRAHMLGQFKTQNEKWIDVQLKGSGKTKYSRQGDGVATLDSILREYIISEALTGIGIPATRTLAVVATGETVFRDFTPHHGAVQVRCAQTHLRVGSFQYAYAKNGEKGVKSLADYVINHHFPKLKNASNQYAQLLHQLVLIQASLIAQWMSVGFVHGVMNTDNMALLETIDFGPCAFLDEFNPNTAFSAIDTQNRYAWSQQGHIGYWNLQRFAETLLPLLHENKEKAMTIANEHLEDYISCFEQELNNTFLKKFGLKTSRHADEFMRNSLIMLAKNNIDFTCFFDALTQLGAYDSKIDIIKLFQCNKTINHWINQWQSNRNNTTKAIQLMKKTNPRVIARNHQVEKAILNATQNGDYTLFNRLCTALQTPYELADTELDLQIPPKDKERVLRTYCGT